MQALADTLFEEQEKEAWQMYMAEVSYRLLPKSVRTSFPTWRSIVSPTEKKPEVTQDGAEILDSILKQALGG